MLNFKLKVNPIRLFVLKDISHPTNRTKHFAVKVFVDLIAQTTNQHIDDIGLRIEAVVINML